MPETVPLLIHSRFLPKIKVTANHLQIIWLGLLSLSEKYNIPLSPAFWYVSDLQWWPKDHWQLSSDPIITFSQGPKSLFLKSGAGIHLKQLWELVHSITPSWMFIFLYQSSFCFFNSSSLYLFHVEKKHSCPKSKKQKEMEELHFLYGVASWCRVCPWFDASKLH